MIPCCPSRQILLGPATLLALFYFLVPVLLPAGCDGGTRQRVLCKYVIDGDTIILSDGRRVRYQGINAPEIPHDGQPGEPFGLRAKEVNRRLVQGKFIDIEISRNQPLDRYNRVIAHVFLRNGKHVGEMLVRAGLAMACTYGKQDRYSKRLLAAQRSAISRKAGIWGLPPDRPEDYYIGNSRSLRFHRPWCKNGRQTSMKNRVIFKSRLKAFKEGYCPCRACRP